MGRYAEAAEEAAKLSNKQLAKKMASLAPLDKDQLQDLLPTKREKEVFLELMRQVEAETDMDERLSYLKENVETAGKVLLRILGAFL